MAGAIEKKNPRLLFELVFFGLIAVFLFWRARYGHYFNDESFLIGLAQRLYKGDSLIVDEWHVCQNVAPLLLPFYSVYYGINGGVEGIILFFRNAYCLIFFVVLVHMHLKLRDFAPLSYVMVLCTALYAPLDFLTLSYTTLSFVALLSICCIVYKDVLTDWHRPFETGLVLGLLATVATLCYPYFAAFFLLYYPAVILCALLGKNKSGEKKTYILRMSFAMALAIGICVAAYAALLLSRVDVSAIMQNLPHILNDPQHPSRGLVFGIYDAVYTSLLTGRENIMDGAIYYFAALALTVFAFISKDRKKYRVFLFLPIFLLWIFNTWDIFALTFLKVNRHMKDFFMLGLLAFALLETRPWKLFLSFYVPSVIYALVVWFSSNTGLIGISMGFALATICAVLLVSMLAVEIYRQYEGKIFRFAAAGIVALAVLFQTGLEFKVRFSYTYQDDAIYELTEKIEYGPEKGILTSKRAAEEYYRNVDSIINALEKHDTAGKSLLALNSEPVVYLQADMDYATYSGWMLGDGNAAKRVRDYYDLNGKASPDFIYDHDGTADITVVTDEEYSVEQHGEAKLYIKK